MTLLERDRQNFEDGLEEGLEQGKLVGLEEGKLEIAKSMKQKGLSHEIIADVTGLTSDTIAIL